MDRKTKVLNLIIEQGMLPLYYHPDAEVSVQILKAMYRAGIRVIEYTNRGDTAWQNFIQLRKVADKELPGLLLGAGTIKDKIAATEFVNEGADFVVCPGVIKEVANVVHNNSLLWIPGCMTTTEIIHAEDLGATLIKLFPANLLNHSYVRAVKEIFPELLFIPTGGVELSEESLNAWFTAGVSSVGIGSDLINKNLIEAGDFVSIETSVRNGLEMVRRIKKD
jgi:2-dehydro-3-deoxyphosphogluconate aldolase / (4S)-4-hydroxy-2-oxoglutarate aldolase